MQKKDDMSDKLRFRLWLSLLSILSRTWFQREQQKKN